MPWYSTFRSDIREWWVRRTRVEKILIYCILAALLVLVIVLSIRNKPPPPLPRVCQTAVCLEEGAKIKESIALDVQPCNSIYTFSCGNFWSDTDPDHDETISLSAFKWQQLGEIAVEPVRKEEHRLVQLYKKIYQACMNDEKIERDRLTTIHEALKAIGGWPIMEGDRWNEENFDWRNLTFKLRQMGYYHYLFLAVKLQTDLDTNKTFILQVSTGDTFNYQYDYYHKSFNVAKIIANIVQIFGGEGIDRIQREVKEILELQKRLVKLEYPDHVMEKRERLKVTVEEYQQQVGMIDWLEYINSIITPSQVTKEELVWVVPPERMKEWLDVVTQTPKRIQANYMIWRMVSDIIDFLNCELRVGNTGLRKLETREGSCFAEANWRFMFNPLSVIAARRNLPKEKREKLKELLLNMKSELEAGITKVKWMDDEDKSKAIETVQELDLLIGLPVDYLDDNVLDDLSSDLVEYKGNETLLSLITQGNRNRLSTIYKQLRLPKKTSLYENGLGAHWSPVYLNKRNAIYVPHVSVLKFFNEKRPNYLNYGAMGSLVGFQLAKLVTSLIEDWSEKTKEAFEEKVKCIQGEMDEYLNKIDKIRWDSSQTLNLTEKAIGEQLAFGAYKNWLKNNGPELPIISVQYTAYQLFWISSANAWCHPYIPPDITNPIVEDSDFLEKLIGVSIGNDESFAKHFDCNPRAIMNPLRRCKIF